jgi:hypothetical protein
VVVAAEQVAPVAAQLITEQLQPARVQVALEFNLR